MRKNEGSLRKALLFCIKFVTPQEGANAFDLQY